MSEIKSGASGNVYEIEIQDGSGSHRLAAKSIMNSEREGFEYLNPDIAKEVGNMIRLNRNANFIEYYGSFKDKNGRVVLLQELGGKDLEQIFVNNSSHLPQTAERLSTFQKMVGGVEVLHNQNLIHGDIKPQNMVRGLDGTTVKIIDTADVQDVSKGQISQSGTPSYMAPEMMKVGPNMQPDPSIDLRKVDIYSLGISFLEMKLGRSIADIMTEISAPSHQFYFNDYVTNGTLFKNLKAKEKLKAKEDMPKDSEMELIFEMINPSGKDRPSITQVKERLGAIENQAQSL